MTPGLEFLGRRLSTLIIPVSSVIILKRIVAQTSVAIPVWVYVIVATLGIPAHAAIRIVHRKLSEHRGAAALDARLAPVVRGKWPGNIDVLNRMAQNFNNGYLGDGLWEFSEELGPVFNLSILWGNVMVTSEPSHIKLILATDFNNYVKGKQLRCAMNSVLGTGVFNSDGEMWKFHRSMTKRFFTKDRISHFDIFDRHAEEAVKQMKMRLREGHAFDFQDAMSRFTLDAATEFLFGSCVNSLSTGLRYPHNVTSLESRLRGKKSADEFADAFARAQYLISGGERDSPLWSLSEIFKAKTDEPMKIVHAYLEPIIQDAVEKQKLKVQIEDKSLEEVDDDETLLDHLVKLTSDPILIRDEVLNIMIAGKDTTAATLTLVIYFLSIYPNVLARLREEILSNVGPSRRPTYDDIRDLKYLRAVINETMRLYPAVPFNVRETVQATTWPSPYPNQKPIYLPGGTMITFSILLMHRRKDLWGPDADEFDPDRFLDDRLKKYLVPNPFIFLPFNAGPRICLGQQFAYNEMSFMLIRLLQNFSGISLDPEAQPPATRPRPEWAPAKGRKAIEQFFPKSHLTIYALGGLWVKMKESESVAGTSLTG